MITFRITADIKDDRQIIVNLPPEVPTGKAELIVTVSQPPNLPNKPRTSLADWADENAEHWGEQLNSEDVEGFTGRSF